MSAIGGVDVFFSGLVLSIRQLLTKWEPGELDSERKYQESLFNFLQTQLPDCIVRREYAEGGSIVDIYLKRTGFWGTDEVFFELKHDLSDKPEFNRLVGQLMDMEPKRRKIIVVLCGKTDRSMLQRLHEYFKDHMNDNYNPWMVGDGEPRMAIVLK